MSGFNTKDVVVLCGGLGTRLRSVLGETQKVMAQVGNRPFLDIIIEHLKKQGFSRVVLCIGFKSEEVKKYYQDNKFGLDIVFSEEQSPMGTGGALKNAQALIATDEFFVLNGDSFCSLDYGALYDFHKKNQAVATIAVSKVDNDEDFGSIKIDSSNRITCFSEKDGGKDSSEGFVNAGVYCFSREVFSEMPSQDVFSLEKDLFPALVNKGFFAFECNEKFVDIGTPERYKKSQDNL